MRSTITHPNNILFLVEYELDGIISSFPRFLSLVDDICNACVQYSSIQQFLYMGKSDKPGKYHARLATVLFKLAKG